MAPRRLSPMEDPPADRRLIAAFPHSRAQSTASSISVNVCGSTPSMPKCTKTSSGGGHDYGLVVSARRWPLFKSQVEVEPPAFPRQPRQAGAAPDPLALEPVRGGPRAASRRCRFNREGLPRGLGHDLSRRDGVAQSVGVCSGRKVSLLMRLPCKRP
jgi:hypothetical protein